jgi:hypothetical protein
MELVNSLLASGSADDELRDEGGQEIRTRRGS